MMYLKTAIILSWYGASYWFLVFHQNTMLEALLLSISLGLAMTGIGFNVAHDGCHGAYSARPAVNRCMSVTLDMLGGSSYVWKWKHNYLHHNYTNLMGADDDIDIGFLGRLSPHSPLRGIHRYQYLYLWLAYGGLALSWQFFVDFERLVRGRVGTQRMPRPRGWDLVTLVAGKGLFVVLMFVIPALVHPLYSVLIFYGVASFTLGWTMSVVFQLAHCVEDAKFPKPRTDTGRMEDEWAVHQVETTVDFARGNRLLTWYLGGLNFQVEHHLFPKVCHLHYPALSAIVERTCSRFGVRYSAYRTMLDALASHHRFLRHSHSRSQTPAQNPA
jgi:linoleoyl-CoA desaturase